MSVNRSDMSVGALCHFENAFHAHLMASIGSCWFAKILKILWEVLDTAEKFKPWSYWRENESNVHDESIRWSLLIECWVAAPLRGPTKWAADGRSRTDLELQSPDAFRSVLALAIAADWRTGVWNHERVWTAWTFAVSFWNSLKIFEECVTLFE